MSRIEQVIGMDNRGSYALVSVVMDDGEEATVYVGGECEVYYDKGQIKAFVKKGNSLTAVARSANLKKEDL